LKRTKRSLEENFWERFGNKNMPIGKKPIQLKEGVTVEKKDSMVTVKGPLGELTVPIPAQVKVQIEGSEVTVGRGTEYALIRNATLGVSEGFTKELELVGVGYRAEKTADGLKLNLGYSHPIEFEFPEGITAEVEGNVKLKIRGIDKQLVAQTAAQIRKLRPPEPYKGRGIKYAQEIVRRKPGKAAKALVGAAGAGGGA